MFKKKFGYMIIVGLFLFFLSGCTIEQPNGDGQNQTGNQTQNQTEGNVVFAITDVAAELENISNVIITIDEIELINQTNESVRLDLESSRFNLLELRNNSEIALLSNQTLNRGTYDRIRLTISELNVVDEQGNEIEATLPNDTILINTDVEVDANSTSLVTLDFLLDESLHVTDNGEYVFAPLIQVDSRKNVSIMLMDRNRIRVENRGEEVSQIRIGMDERGNVGVGRGIDRNANITIDDGRIQIRNQTRMNDSQRDMNRTINQSNR